MIRHPGPFRFACRHEDPVTRCNAFVKKLLSEFQSRLAQSVRGALSLFSGKLATDHSRMSESTVRNSSSLCADCDAPRQHAGSGIAGSLRFRFILLLLVMLLGAASPALAGEFCVQAPSPFGIDEDGDGINDYGIIDGDDPATTQFIIDNNVTQITIDGDCTFSQLAGQQPVNRYPQFPDQRSIDLPDHIR